MGGCTLLQSWDFPGCESWISKSMGKQSLTVGAAGRRLVGAGGVLGLCPRSSGFALAAPSLPPCSLQRCGVVVVEGQRRWQRKIYHDQRGGYSTIKWSRWLMAAEANYAEQIWVWTLVNADNFSGWQRNCNDQGVIETKKIGMNGMDFFVFLC
jgi:hypothetical protein